MAKANDGSPGIDGKDFEDIEREGLEEFLEGIRQELLDQRYQPLPNRRVEIPKGNGKTRTLGIPTVKDRVVQGALKLILEPIFEADFKGCSYGYRPKRHAHQAIGQVTKGILYGLTRVVDVDLSGYFDNIRHHKLLEKVARRVQDDDIMHLIKLIRSADDMVILVHWHPKEDWLLQKVQKRLKEELDKLEVEMNLEKTKVVDLKKGGSFSFLGFDIRLNCLCQQDATEEETH